jgi:ketosteroid isomerase-like protein
MGPSVGEGRVGKEEEAAVSSAEENKALVRRLCDAIDEGNLDAIRELLAPDFVDHGLLPGQEDPGREGYVRMVADHHAVFSDIHTTIEYQATDDMVITRYTTYGIHDREAVLGMEPTGREWKLTHVDIHRISGGKIVEAWRASGAGPILEVLAQEIRERERRARARRAGATGGSKHPASLTPQGGAHPRGLGDRPTLPAR